MRRGRTRSNSDDEAIATVADVHDFLQKSRLSATGLARKIKVSPSSVLRALQTDPPTWTPTLTALNNFIKSQTQAKSGSGSVLEDQLRRLRGTGSASATAAVLRAVADLLESEAAR